NVRSIGIKTLKNKLSEYVKIAAGGETVLVTDRDKVVAELVPPRAGRSASVADALLADVVRRGWLTPPLSDASLPAREPVAPLDAILEELERDRRDR
ncbi:MAG: type II toxin-antitoxin system Phd/YefM family antitoxin, partial [Planctomycetota bacterium]